MQYLGKAGTKRIMKQGRALVFPEDPDELRSRFVEAASEQSLKVVRYPGKAVDSEGACFADVVQLGEKTAPRKLLICSGAGGASSLLASGLSLAVLEGHLTPKLPEHVAVVVVSAVRMNGPLWPQPVRKDRDTSGTTDGLSNGLFPENSKTPAADKGTSKFLTATFSWAGLRTIFGQGARKQAAAASRDALNMSMGSVGEPLTMDVLLNRAQDRFVQYARKGAQEVTLVDEVDSIPPAFDASVLRRLANRFLSNTDYLVLADVRVGPKTIGDLSILCCDPVESVPWNNANSWFRLADLNAAHVAGLGRDPAAGGFGHYVGEAGAMSLLLEVGVQSGAGLRRFDDAESPHPHRSDPMSILPQGTEWADQVLGRLGDFLDVAIDRLNRA